MPPTYDSTEDYQGALPAEDLAERLKALWRQGQQPDVDSFLARAGARTPAQAAAVLRVDQRQRWQAGERVRVETYLHRHPDIHSDAEAAVDLIYNEFLLRERLGERPEVAEYLRRFPRHAPALRAQAELHQAMLADSPTTAPALQQPHEAQPERMRTALVAGPSPRATAELQTLLRSRLGFLSLLATVGYACASTIYFIDVIWITSLTSRPFAQLWIEPLSSWTAFLVTIVLTAILWSPRLLTLSRLRVAEIILFGLPLAHVTWYYVDQLWFNHLLLHTFLERPFLVPFILSTFVLPVVVFIVGYGTLVPNTGRRCGWVVTAMAAVPVTLVTAVGFAEEPIRTAFLLPFLINLLVVVMWMGVAVALAVHGSHRIEFLRREASAARQLGQYRLKQRLGSGGMGEVYLAEHVLLRRPCALKVIRPERAGDPKHLLRFEREVQATAALTHPNTVQVFDYGRAEDGTFYYAMEYLPGLNLEELVKRHGPLPPERVVHLLRQACGALHEAHGVGLIHRDIKPSNILSCERGGIRDVAKLLDFGLVRSHALGAGADNLTQEGSIAGTPAYMSPEQADAQKDLDARSDIYSLGGVAYFLLTGQPPFVRPTALQTLIAHVSDPPIPPDQLRAEVPPDLQAVVLRCLQKDPAQRFPDARSLEKALAACRAAGTWTEERVALEWQGQPGLSKDPDPEATTRVT